MINCKPIETAEDNSVDLQKHQKQWQPDQWLVTLVTALSGIFSSLETLATTTIKTTKDLVTSAQILFDTAWNTVLYNSKPSSISVGSQWAIFGNGFGEMRLLSKKFYIWFSMTTSFPESLWQPSDLCQKRDGRLNTSPLPTWKLLTKKLSIILL